MSEIFGFVITQALKAIGRVILWALLAFIITLFFDDDKLNLFLTAWVLFCVADFFIWLVNTMWVLVSYKLTKKNRIFKTKEALSYENYINASQILQYDPEYWIIENLGHFVDDVFKDHITDYDEAIQNAVVTPFHHLSALVGYRQALKETNLVLFWIAEGTLRKALKENAKAVANAVE